MLDSSITPLSRQEKGTGEGAEAEEDVIQSQTRLTEQRVSIFQRLQNGISSMYCSRIRDVSSSVGEKDVYHTPDLQEYVD